MDDKTDEMMQAILDQNQELMKIMSDTVKSVQETQAKGKRLPWIVCLVAVLASVAILISTFVFFSQYEFYYEEVVQDTGEGSGNNVYLPGENAQYQQQADGGGNNVYLPGTDAQYAESEDIDGETDG